jgi:hypothetical protein
MRGLFPGHYRPRPAEFEKLWKDCIFSFDANVLLGVYRYTDTTRNTLLKVLEALRDRVWLTHRAAAEFQRHRIEVIGRERATFEEHQKKVASILKDTAKHAFLSPEQVSELDQTRERLSALLQDALKRQPDLLWQDDSLRDRLDTIFIDRVGEPCTADEERIQHAEADARIGRRQPPGYLDDAKTEAANRRGDAVLWLQLLAHAKKQQKAVIFVTDERKDDWWIRHSGKTIGPRSELIEEFGSHTGQQFYMYDIGSFLEHAQKHVQAIDVDAAVAEVRQRGPVSGATEVAQLRELARSRIRYLESGPAAVESFRAIQEQYRDSTSAAAEAVRALGERYFESAPSAAKALRAMREQYLESASSAAELARTMRDRYLDEIEPFLSREGSQHLHSDSLPEGPTEADSPKHDMEDDTEPK